MKEDKFLKTSLYTFFIVYLIILAFILLFKSVSIFELFSLERSWDRSVNLMPFGQFIDYFFGIADVSWTVIKNNIFGNIVLFIPLGIYLNLFLKNQRPLVITFIIFLTSILIEITQFSFAIGAMDIDDVLLNTIGGAIGVAIYYLLLKFFKHQQRVETFVSILASGVGVFIITLFSIVFFVNA